MKHSMGREGRSVTCIVSCACGRGGSLLRSLLRSWEIIVECRCRDYVDIMNKPCRDLVKIIIDIVCIAVEGSLKGSYIEILQISLLCWEDHCACALDQHFRGRPTYRMLCYSRYRMERKFTSFSNFSKVSNVIHARMLSTGSWSRFGKVDTWSCNQEI